MNELRDKTDAYDDRPKPAPPADGVVEQRMLDAAWSAWNNGHGMRGVVRAVLDAAGFEQLRKRAEAAEASDRAASAAIQNLLDRTNLDSLEHVAQDFALSRMADARLRIAELESENERLRKVVEAARWYAQIPSTEHYIALQGALDAAQPKEGWLKRGLHSAAQHPTSARLTPEDEPLWIPGDDRHERFLAALAFEAIRQRDEYERQPQGVGTPNRAEAFERFYASVKERAK